ncbi:Uncharacterized protein PBTT_07334 [Plasmodiophora brassicae]
MNYSVAVPALVPLAQAAGQAVVVGSAAAGVAAGAPMAAHDILDAASEVDARKRLRLSHPGRITAEEFVDAPVREHAIVSQQASSVYPAAGAPAWFAPAMAAALGPVVNHMNHINARLDGVCARLDNTRIRARHASRAGLNTVLLPVLKETAGHPAGQTPAVFSAAIPAGAAEFPVGAPLPDVPFFPRAGLSSTALNALPGAHLARLEWFYNVDLGNRCCLISVTVAV